MVIDTENFFGNVPELYGIIAVLLSEKQENAQVLFFFLFLLVLPSIAFQISQFSKSLRCQVCVYISAIFNCYEKFIMKNSVKKLGAPPPLAKRGESKLGMCMPFSFFLALFLYLFLSLSYLLKWKI